ncbi:MAG: glycosyltransferase family 1 protein [Leptolyngbyaceae cyanobacterium bins.59]|nr:glycosyltransferase family 1 protein [Leptolyngbyaceae cyanobacterium bins.59]
MTIRVAYDISMLCRFYFRHKLEKFGIFRVTEEVLHQMVTHPEIDLTLCRLCEEMEGDRVYETLRYYFYLEDRNTFQLPFEDPFASRLGLVNLYKQVYLGRYAPAFEKLASRSPRSLYLRGMRKVLSLLQSIDLYKAFRADRYDIFHSTFLQLPPRELTGQTIRVLTVYDLIPVVAPHLVAPHMTQAFQKILDSIDIHRDWLVAISEHTKQEFCEYLKVSPDRVIVAPLAAADHFYPIEDPERIQAARHRYDIPEGEYFLCLATLQPRKNLVHLIRCFIRLIQEQPSLDVNLLLVGHKGWMYDEIFATVESLTPEIRSRVIMTGHIPDCDISEIYSGARAFILPSLYEGFGLPALEAMQCGTPVISSNVTSLPEVMGDAALLIDPRDADQLCQAMLTILTDSALAQELGRRGRERSHQFSWQHCADRVIQTYQQAMAAAG